MQTTHQTSHGQLMDLITAPIGTVRSIPCHPSVFPLRISPTGVDSTILSSGEACHGIIICIKDCQYLPNILLARSSTRLCPPTDSTRDQLMQMTSHNNQRALCATSSLPRSSDAVARIINAIAS